MEFITRLINYADCTTAFIGAHKKRVITQVISINDTEEIEGGNAYVQWGTTAAGGALGSYLGAARYGAILGSAAGPVGTLVGGSLAFGATYVYLNYVM